jgi:ABC-type Co2+ transport system permease subunit
MFFQILWEESKEFFTDTFLGVAVSVVFCIATSIGVYWLGFSWIYSVTNNIFIAGVVPLVVAVMLYLLGRTIWVYSRYIRRHKQDEADSYML